MCNMISWLNYEQIIVVYVLGGLYRKVLLNMEHHCGSVPPGSEPVEQPRSLPEEPPLFQHCAGGNGPGYLGFLLNVAQCGR